MRIITLIYILLAITSILQGQAIRLNLDEVIQIAQEQSIVAKQASTLRTTQYWEWRSFKANYRPQITLSGELPDFRRSFEEVIQQNGSIAFQSVAQNNARVGISLSQQIPATGATLFLSSSLQRFDDFDRDFQLYNTAPFQLGFIQPIFKFNNLKWDKKIQPLKYQESRQDFIANMENIAETSVGFFFRLMIAQIDKKIAETNRENTDTIYQITLEKYKLGKASRNDILQLRMEKLKAAKALAVAEQDLEIASRLLKSYIGSRNADSLLLELPIDIPQVVIPTESALKEAFQNLPDAIAYKRRSLEADQDIAKARESNGFSAELIGSFGLNKSAPVLSDAYQELQNQQILYLKFSIPVVDWGRSKAQRETAEANKQLVLFQIEQDQIDLEQSIVTELRLLQRFTDQLHLNKETDEVAQMRYQIAQDRFLLGDLSITDLSIALQEKDQAKRDYIRSVWDFWQSFYRIRALTLYDFVNQKKIQY